MSDLQIANGLEPKCQIEECKGGTFGSIILSIESEAQFCEHHIDCLLDVFVPLRKIAKVSIQIHKQGSPKHGDRP